MIYDFYSKMPVILDDYFHELEGQQSAVEQDDKKTSVDYYNMTETDALTRAQEISRWRAN